MKNLFTKTNAFIIAFIFVSNIILSQSNTVFIHGKIEGKENGFLSLGYSGGKRNLETITLKNGRFSYTKEISDSKEYFLCYSRPNMQFSTVNMFLSPGDSVYIEGTIKDKKKKLKLVHGDTTVIIHEFTKYKVLGGKYQDDYKTFLDSKNKSKNKRAYKEWRKAYKAKDTALYELISYQATKPIFDYIKKNPGSEFSAFALKQCMKAINKDTIKNYLNALSNNLDSSFYVKWINEYFEIIESREKKKKIKKINVGEDISEVQFSTIDNQKYSVKDFKGKYLILDFWTTWCGPCIHGIPVMKEYSKKYKDKIEIVGVSCDRSIEATKKAITKYDLKWKNIFNSKETGNLEEKFGVKGYPTKIIIDKNGYVLRIFVGESKGFYKQLKKLK